ncbi:8-oxo-dGTP pyrophosphatase MutT (NUDIX family) [Aeromicrobium panaciterrae]|uniref:8-oxo-dGTP pyrophosphatase MutT (NUDIX family) n=1 Tax=Aeromicrobium panaciterrae TaxID=363861 RepID=A0ABU1URI8_9ACTN|nr:NUDIX domain-containing protein [Aeromicrobium panaciterrae]MDR7087804.1 8-oxo-dGTP pyrophosphatase MutT (NUDIX family) [Aeromicrobium panaciterrae]
MPEPTRTQRLGAYAVVTDGERILLTRISAVGYPTGWWGLPGGGVDHGESPNVAVRRELYEETGLKALSARLMDVHDIHIVEVGRGDMYEDYHGVHLLYAVEIEPGTEPHVVELDGTTDDVRWVAFADVGSAVEPVLPVVTYAVENLGQFTS